MDTNPLYRSLDGSKREIRLLTLLPGGVRYKGKTTIACRLETVSLSDDPEYTAISYVWGDASVTIDILVNNIACPVTANILFGLLRFYQYGLGLPEREDERSMPRLWVDAICINQQDTAERNQQVGLMGDIYRGARYVLTSLGQFGQAKNDEIDSWIRRIRNFSEALPAELKQLVLDRLQKQGEQDQIDERLGNGDSYDGTGRGLSPLLGEDGTDLETEIVQEGLKWISEHPELHDRDVDGTSEKVWISLVHLTHHQYWKRVWVQQEMVLCRTFSANLIRCAAEMASFEDVVLFFTFIFALDSRTNTASEMRLEHWEFIMQYLKGPIVAPIIHLGRVWRRGVPCPSLVPSIAQQCKATDPRDMVYGLRSLLHLKLDVNYDKTVREVYLDWHAEAMEHCRARGELENCGINWAGRGLSDNNPRDLPSWMPDLATLHESRCVYQHRGGTKIGPGGRFQLAGPDGQHYSEHGILSVYGIALDRVRKYGNVKNNAKDAREVMRKQAVDYLLEFKERDHPTGLRPLQAMFYTIHHGIDPDTKSSFLSCLQPTSSAHLFRYLVLDDQVNHPSQDWSHADLQAAGGLRAYMESRFRDTADEDENKRWSSDGGQASRNDFLTEGQVISRFAASVRLFVANRSIFYTTGGYIGIGPKYMQVGDQLCVINPCHLPVLLRAEGSGHVLVGAVYVYGLSENEPLDMLKSGQVSLRKFEIH